MREGEWGMGAKTEKKMVTEVFIEGARKGLKIGTNSIIPNILMAYVLISVLKISGLLDVLSRLLDPLMAVFTLPGAAATVILSAWMGTAGGVGVAVGLFTEGLLDAHDIMILTPAIFLLGAQIQYIGRVLNVAGVKSRHYLPLLAISIINAMLGMLVMRIFV